MARARVVNAAVDGLVLADESALGVLTSSPYVVSHDWPGAKRRLATVQAERPRWRDVFLTDLRTRRVLWDTADTVVPQSPAPPWMAGHLANPLSPPIGQTVADGPGCPCVTIHVPVIEAGAPRYLLSAKLGTRDYQAALLANSPAGGVSAIVDSTGRFLARTTAYETRVGAMATRFVRDAIASGRSGFYPGVTFEGFRNYTAFEASSLTGWSTHIAVSRDLLGGPRRVSVALILAAGAAAIARAAILALVVWRQLESRRREEARTAQAEKLAAIGQLASGISHDFNNLLTVISTSAEFLSRPDLSEPRRLRYVAAISESARRAAALTGQLLAFARRQSLAPRTFDVGREIERGADLIRPMIGEGVSLELVLCVPPCLAHADVDQFQAALLNLAANARDAMDGAGRLSIAVATCPAIPPCRGQPRRVGAFAMVTISDTGVGLERRRLDSIFEPFVTSKDVGKGTGLGLSQVLGFTQQSGGDVTVDSAVGKGTTFRLYLPAAKADLGSSAAVEPASSTESRAKTTSIMVVEDDESVGRCTTEMLHDLGFNATWVACGPEAIGLLTVNAARFDLLLSDVVMPGMTGLELARTVRRSYPHMAILLASGYSGVSHTGDLQGLEILPKPYDRAALSAAVERALRQPRGAIAGGTATSP